MKENKKKYNKIVLLARSKLNSVENILSKPLTDVGISHEEFTLVVRHDENIRMVKSQRSDIVLIR